ncbi:glutamate 5-kinase [Peribacillus frigoritolerans]|jgi:glutamate 5-kinase|uniref:glutamate 5-kinase n=1 Tax=Peribacillus frigoritolerans TaxID=450367 RepID=UPI000BACA967|nr:glutamate 5-kinase [Peribacillus frigoritolerans]MDP9740412.1 glutamate 5-kinase [Bacillus sp. B2I3]PAW28091.1 glutamate 5-kinase [Peribacillus simplex]MED3708830.1 glutamate 5-kinase [Peribacillus frigoritolerans]MED3833436.1 glutamate 5-kinase [Peribacillus frigoritolerans]MED3848134.1 glutamate 5-kinase [Peribacillus frigoritolerans]
MEKKRIVVKIGSSSLTNTQGEIDQNKFSDHIQAVAALRKAGHEVVLVSSGAVATGFRKLGYPTRPVTLKGKQAAAAVGQSLLIQSYMEQLGHFGIVPAQILLTRKDFSKKDRYKNAYATLMELLERGILPIINENDTVSVEELTFGDNDMLSALVSGLVHATNLIILTDINGLYDSNPQTNPGAKRFDKLSEVTDDLLQMAEGAGSNVGTGGMKSKLIAAQTALSLGVKVFIGSGLGSDKLLTILEGNGDGTYIGNEDMAMVTKNKQWISLHSKVSGKIFVDEGAERALVSNGSSLLPAGIYEIKGVFNKGDVVEVFGANGLLGRGEVLYSDEELKQAMGKRTSELIITSIEVIHRDKWVKA